MLAILSRFRGLLIIFILLLTACASTIKNQKRTPYCDELRSQIVFGGSIGTNQPNYLTHAESALSQRTFDQECIER